MPKKDNEMKIEIDVTDWNEEYQMLEVDVSGKEQIFERAKEGIHPAQMGRLYLVARERMETDPDLLPGNKAFLQTGAAVNVTRLQVEEKKKIKLKSGKEIETRRLVCPTPAEEDQVVVESNTKAALNNAVYYMLNTVIGHIVGRLKIIVENGGSAMTIWDEVDMKMRKYISEVLE